jgi:transcriptional regulator with XRE-family HTH domain
MLTDTQKREPSAFATALRRFRSSRRMSQLDLALASDVSSRHVSFLESGRAQPSRDMVLQLGAALLLPLQARNGLLQAAGFTPAFPASPLDSESLSPFRAILNDMIARHAPYPAMLVDRHWTVLEANASARALLDALGGDGEHNIVRMMTQSPQAEALIANYAEVLSELQSRMQMEALEAGDDPVFGELLGMLERACARFAPASATAPRRPLLPLIIHSPAGPLSFLSAIAHFGTTEDVTIRDLRLELLFPADDQTRAALAAL